MALTVDQDTDLDAQFQARLIDLCKAGVKNSAAIERSREFIRTATGKQLAQYLDMRGHALPYRPWGIK